ncbi:MAG: DUF3576 domain-containing protein [Magnetovibrionaceae bacterium]
MTQLSHRPDLETRSTSRTSIQGNLLSDKPTVAVRAAASERQGLRWFRLLSLVTLLFCLMVVLGGCEGGQNVNTEKRPGTNADLLGSGEQESIFGEGGFSIFGADDKSTGGGGGGGIGVNTYLWRASLDTISFMPVTSADAFGGVIITDWHSSADSPDERFKLNVYILGRSLRADGIRVAAFRQVRRGSAWVDAAMPNGTEIQIEDAILTKARQLRNITLQE